jgi:hypothetical protein
MPKVVDESCGCHLFPAEKTDHRSLFELNENYGNAKLILDVMQ